MRIVKTLTGVLGVLLAFGALSASGAEAHEWKLNGVALTKAVSVAWTSTLKFEDTYHEMNFRCTIAYQGTVGPGTAGEITGITSTSGAKLIPCTVEKGGIYGYKTVELEAEKLPWKTTLVTSGSELRDSIAGYLWAIHASGGGAGSETNDCGAESSTAMRDYSLGVEATFDAESPTTHCDNDPHGGLRTKGVEDIEASSGTLSVEAENANAKWLFNGSPLEKAVTVTSKGTLKLSDKETTGHKVTIECASADEGTVSPGGTGELTSVKVTSCKFIELGACSSEPTVEAKNLPWRTGIVTYEGTTRQYTREAGKGAPGFAMTCKTILGKSTDTCTGGSSARVSTVTGGVEETFDSSSEKLNCTIGGTATGTIEGSQLLKSASGTLSFEAGL
jgi:hypothetical protein